MAESRPFAVVLLVFAGAASAQRLVPPAGVRPARAGLVVSILPGGRVIAPLGEQYLTGPEPVAMALSASGKTLVSANLGLQRSSLTVIEHDKSWSIRHLPAEVPGPQQDAADEQWHSVAGGLAFSGEHSVFVAEGRTGRIALIDLDFGYRRRAISLGAPGSISGALALDAARNVLYAADLGHSRLVALDTRSRQVLATVELDGVPVALALAPDRRRLYVGCASNLLAGRGIPPPGLVAVDVSEPRAARVEWTIRAGDWPASGVAGILATENRVFLSDPRDDRIVVVDPQTRQIAARIPLRIPGLEGFRGVLPMGLAYDSGTGWLLVAEAGINAVGVIDTRSRNVLEHLPAGWFPERLLVNNGMVYVQNRGGRGSGPDLKGYTGAPGSISVFPLPASEALPGLTRWVMEAAGFIARPGPPKPLPEGIRHVVLIVKESRSFDEVLGDVTRASNGPVMGAPPLARFGRDGYADGEKKRLSLHHIDITPNHHAVAARWTLSDNFYAGPETNEAGLESLSVWNHLARHGVSFARFGAPFDAALSDAERARRAIEDIDTRYGRPGADLPRVVMIRLPNDRMAEPRPEAGYPYAASYVADNDVALGRILEYFSHTKWWSRMAVFVTEASAEGGIDHIDAHRTLLLCAGPWARKNRVSHANTNFAGLLKTVFRLVRVPPLGLADASAADLGDCFTDEPDAAPYPAADVDPRLYRPPPAAAPTDWPGRN